MKELIHTIQKYLKCINIQLLKDDGQTIEHAADMVKNFKERVQLVKETRSLTMDDFSKVARIESMLAVFFDHLEAHKIKVMQVNMDKEVCKQHILYIGLPHYQVILNFSTTHLDWWNVCGTAVKQDKPIVSFATLES